MLSIIFDVMEQVPIRKEVAQEQGYKSFDLLW